MRTANGSIEPSKKSLWITTLMNYWSRRSSTSSSWNIWCGSTPNVHITDWICNLRFSFCYSGHRPSRSAITGGLIQNLFALSFLLYAFDVQKLPQKPVGSAADQKLDRIIDILELMNKRDKMRTWGGLVRTIIHFIPLIILIWSVWFTYAHWDEMLREISRSAAEQSAAMMQKTGSGWTQQFQNQIDNLMGR